MTPEEYCREIEAYLCRKNDGHLIRIVGPSFERVCAWAEQGIPFKIACQGIDQYFTRYYAKGPRRRPVQIDFCDADVLDAFDAWRRAVGVRPPGAAVGDAETTHKQRQSLPEHLRRVLERLTAVLSSPRELSPRMRDLLDAAASDVAALSDLPSPLRGEVRQRVTTKLADLDRQLIDAAREEVDARVRERLRTEAEEQLASFRERMPAADYDRVVDAAIDRLLRERTHLPSISFE